MDYWLDCVSIDCESINWVETAVAFYVQTKSVYHYTIRDASWEDNDIWTVEMPRSEEQVHEKDQESILI